ncbi:MAG TPA: formyltransferase family protein [Candidatus Levybacteria bacterium]|nr:formyltransferase family protein [Candidatus Levybacteria bacterium]
MKKLVVLISDTGKGSNMRSLIDACMSGLLRAEIVQVISDTENAKGLAYVRENNIPYSIVPNKNDLLSKLQVYTPDFICLSGWKQFIVGEVIDEFQGKITNLHPGIIPETINGEYENPDGTKALWNRGKLTGAAIQNVLNSHATYAGSSIHILTHEFDFGPVLGRCFEKVIPQDTVESLYTRLKTKENKLYQEVMIQLCH